MNLAFGTHNPIRLSTESAESAFSYQPGARAPGLHLTAGTKG